MNSGCSIVVGVNDTIIISASLPTVLAVLSFKRNYFVSQEHDNPALVPDESPRTRNETPANSEVGCMAACRLLTFAKGYRARKRHLCPVWSRDLVVLKKTKTKLNAQESCRDHV